MRQYPNNTILLAANNGDLFRIRQSIATMEAADQLLRDPARSLPEHRRAILEQEKADAEKNATTDIQNKWSHLFSAGNSPQHQWPEQNSHLEVQNSGVPRRFRRQGPRSDTEHPRRPGSQGHRSWPAQISVGTHWHHHQRGRIYSRPAPGILLTHPQRTHRHQRIYLASHGR